MRILMVEDNSSYGELLYDGLSKIGDTAWLISESDFIENLAAIQKEPPDVAVIDSMLRWDVPRREPRPVHPDAVDLYTAGIRCARRLAEEIPVLLFTVINEEDLRLKVPVLPPNVTYVRKTSDITPVTDAVRKLAAGRLKG